MRARAPERLYLRIIQMNAVGQRNVRPRQPERIKIGDIAQARLALDHRYLVHILRSVRVHHHAALARETRHLNQKLTRATDGEARGEAAAYAPTGAAVPLFYERERFAQRGFPLLM